jgi:hypothetical protein
LWRSLDRAASVEPMEISDERSEVNIAFGRGNSRGFSTPRPKQHLFQRIIERSGQAVDSFAEVLERLSDVWLALMWMRSHRILSGRGFIPHEFMTPWENGLLFGKVEKLVGLPDAKPLVYIVRSGPAQRGYLPDLYWRVTSLEAVLECYAISL